MFLRRRKKGDSLDIPMSSMIDVVFLLLIYFVVTQKEDMVEAHLAVNLPSPSPSPEDMQEKPSLLEIEVGPQQFLLGSRAVTLSELENKLATLTAYDKEQTVVIKTSPRAPTQRLVDVLDICHGLGLEKLNVMTLK